MEQYKKHQNEVPIFLIKCSLKKQNQNYLGLEKAKWKKN